MTLANWEYDPDIDTEDLGEFQYKEHRESGKESYSPGNSSASRVFLVAWEERAAFLDDLLGYSILNGTDIERVVPDPHPEVSNFYAASATVEGMGILGKNSPPTPSSSSSSSGEEPLADFLTWTIAKISCEYRPLDYAVLEDDEVTSEMDRYIVKTYAFNCDYLTINGGMRFVTPNAAGGKTVLSSPPGKVTATMELVYTWKEVPAKSIDPFTPPNLDAITDCLGKVNSVPFDVLGANFPAGTVLFLGVDPKMVMPRLSGDAYYWEIAHKFLYRDNGAGLSGETAGHQYVYRTDLPGGGKWDLITHDGNIGGNRIYQTTDLNELFTIS